MEMYGHLPVSSPVFGASEACVSLSRHPKEKDQTFCLTITSDRKDNVKTSFFGRKYIHTIDKSDLKRIKDIIAKAPEHFRLPPIEPGCIAP